VSCALACRCHAAAAASARFSDAAVGAAVVGSTGEVAGWRLNLSWTAVITVRAEHQWPGGR